MIAAALAWFDETPATLARCVASLADIAETLVSLDGRWELFPGPANVSPLEQAEAIHTAAAGAGIRVLDESCRSDRPWPSQVAKRSTLMTLASGLEPWVLVIDGDEHIAHADEHQLRDELASTDLDVAAVSLLTQGEGIFNQRPRPRRRIYRSAAGITVERAHNGYRASDGRWLNGDERHVQLTEALDAAALVQITHDHDARSADRRRRRDAYYRLRPAFEGEWAAA